jgi:hypothetical protein
MPKDFFRKPKPGGGSLGRHVVNTLAQLHSRYALLSYESLLQKALLNDLSRCSRDASAPRWCAKLIINDFHFILNGSQLERAEKEILTPRAIDPTCAKYECGRI